MLESCCCSAKPCLDLVHLDNDGHYFGKCSKCRDDTRFAQVLDSSGPEYKIPEEISENNN